MVSKRTYKFTMKMKNLWSTKTLIITNISITPVEKRKKEEEEAKFTINILKYTLIKNLK